MKNLLMNLFIPLATQQVHAADRPDGVKLLSSHETIAVFNGTRFQKCRHHAGKMPHVHLDLR
ncbi:hypothetical protein BSZ32_00430 [Rubritalea profundi]|uniref:Uncharacterized protein n=2 Tax=Rubritalea profundi TaxID=1658618 RepID=A0A2S7TWJ5_9BACT|nr:hypothetical protein BSZ32_00430 [Rubritalea profundi]